MAFWVQQQPPPPQGVAKSLGRWAQAGLTPPPRGPKIRKKPGQDMRSNHPNCNPKNLRTSHLQIGWNFQCPWSQRYHANIKSGTLFWELHTGLAIASIPRGGDKANYQFSGGDKGQREGRHLPRRSNALSKNRSSKCNQKKLNNTHVFHRHESAISRMYELYLLLHALAAHSNK